MAGATRTPTTRVGQPSCATPSSNPATVPPVPSGATIASGGAGSCCASSSAARKCPTTARGCAPPPGIQRRGPNRRAPCHAARRASGRAARVGARTTSVAWASQAAATARLASVSGCGNWASATRQERAAACTAVARQWVEPVPPTVTNTLPAGASARRNSSPRTLLPPQRGAERSSRLSHSASSPRDARKAGAGSSGVGQRPRLQGASASRIFRVSRSGSDTANL